MAFSEIVLILVTNSVYSLSFPTDDNIPQVPVVQEVEEGRNAVLNCTSNNNDHLFSFWEILEPNKMFVGPGNLYDKIKYDFRVLSGDLIIRDVSPYEEGLYTCVSIGIRTNNVHVNTVRIVLIQESSKANQFRTFEIIVMCISITILIASAVFFYRQRPKIRNGSEMDLNYFDEDEDSAEELFSKPTQSNVISTKPDQL